MRCRSVRGNLVPMDDEERWAAVVARDVSADGAFVYGVVTTGVFCRPSCPSKQARRANVVFFPDVAAAAASGLRPCLRCRPTEPAGAHRSELVGRACRILDEAPTAPTLAELADRLEVSPYHLHRSFRAETGITPKAWADARRAERVRARLQEGAGVTEAVYDAGYGSSSRFYEGSARRLGMTPGELRAGASGVTVTLATGESSLGTVLVGATARGICAVDLGDEPDELLAAARERFHGAELVTGDPGFAALVARVVALVDEPGRPAGAARLPLDVRGTAFQERVWRALQEVPVGSTTTYAGVAASIGSPSSARAVAAACAANAVAVVVPCHRVVRGDGDLAGYRWGLERKAALLRREGAVVPRRPGGSGA